MTPWTVAHQASLFLPYLPEFAQTHVHRVSDAIQPSHPLSPLPPSPLAFNLSQHQSLFQWISSSHQVAKVLEFQLQTSVLPMNIQNWFPLGLTNLISLLSKGLSRVWKHQFWVLQCFTAITLQPGLHCYLSLYPSWQYKWCACDPITTLPLFHDSTPKPKPRLYSRTSTRLWSLHLVLLLWLLSVYYGFRGFIW